MSIKIHGGRQIDAPIGRAYEMLVAAKGASARIGRDLEVSWMARRAARLVDDARMAGGEAEHPLHDAWCEMSDRQREVRRTRHRDPDVDFEFELWMWPHGGRTLINLHTEQEAYRQWFDGLSFTQDHSYWDNADPDEGVDAAAWNGRRDDWHAVWPVGTSPSDRCVTMVMFNHELPMPADAEKAVTHVPSIDARLSAAASRRHMDEVHRKLVDDLRAKDPDWRMEGFGTLFEAQDIARRDEGRRDEIVEGLRPFIREIAADDLAPSRRTG